METRDFIKNLSTDLAPSRPAHFYRTSFVSWSVATLALLGLYFFLIPVRPDLSLRFTSFLFDGETVLFVAAFLISTFVAYRSAIPGLLRSREQWIAGSLLTALILAAIAVSRTSVPDFSSFSSEFRGEMNFYRGRCGPLLLAVGFCEAGLFFVLAKRAASTNPFRTGAWIGLSSGALGLVTTQLICTHENFLHVVIWHALPVALLAAGGAILGRRLLRW